MSMDQDFWGSLQVDAAKSKRDRDDPEIQPSTERMKAEHKIPSAPSTDQKRVRRQMQRSKTGSQKETHSVNTETELLHRMHVAASVDERQHYATQLESFRAQKAASYRQQAEVDFGSQVLATTRQAHPLSSMGGNFTTMETDWLGSAATPKVASRDIENAMRAQASVWFGSRTAAVRADGQELAVQADGMARQAAGQYGDQFAVAKEAFIEAVRHLASRTADRSQYQPPEGSSLPTGSNIDKVFSPLTWDGTTENTTDQKSTDSNFSSPSLDEGDTPESDHSEDPVSNPVNDNTHVNDGGNASHTDVLNGTVTPWPGNADSTKKTMSSRKQADTDFQQGWDAYTSGFGGSVVYDAMSGEWQRGWDSAAQGEGVDSYDSQRVTSRRQAADQQSTDSNFSSPSLSEGGSTETGHQEPWTLPGVGNHDESSTDGVYTDELDLTKTTAGRRTATSVGELSNVMDFDHVVQVHEDGSVTGASGQYAPSVYEYEGSTGDPEIDGSGWSFFSKGYTGQHGYNGPVMHASEQLSGRLAQDILDTPGYYVVTSVEDPEDPDNPSGWTVLTKPAPRTSGRRQAADSRGPNGSMISPTDGQVTYMPGTPNTENAPDPLHRWITQDEKHDSAGGTTAALRYLARSIASDEQQAGGMHPDTVAYVQAMASLTAEGFAGVSPTDVAAFVLEAPMRGTKRTAHRQALRQVMAGDVPEAFKKNWNKDGDSDPDSKSDDDKDSDTKGDTTGNGKPDWLDDKIKGKSSSRKTAGHEIDVATAPSCDVCKYDNGVDTPAAYDARLPGKGGSWGNVCQRHFDAYGPGQTGTGHAQKFNVTGSRKTAADSPEFLKSYEKAFDDYDEQDGDKPSTDGMTGDAKAGYEAGWTDASSHESKSSSRRTAADSDDKGVTGYCRRCGRSGDDTGLADGASKCKNCGWEPGTKVASRQQPQPRIAAFARSLQAGLRATALGAEDEGEFMKGYNHANNPTSDGADPKSQSEAWQKGFKAGMEDKGMDH
jgi:hypothetical protein